MISLISTIYFAKHDDKQHDGLLDATLLALLSGIVGGRITFVATHWTYYQENVGEIIMISHGGLNYHGAILGGLIALWLWASYRKVEFTPIVAILTPALIVGNVFGWLACWFEGCAYGQQADFGFFAANLPDAFGVYALRYQTQLMGIIMCLLILGIVLATRRRISDAILFWFTFFLLSSGRLAISLFRGDTAPIIMNLRLDSLVDGILAFVSLTAMLLIIGRQRLVRAKA